MSGKLKNRNRTKSEKNFTNCFKNSCTFEEQSTKWREVLDEYFQKAFKKIRISNKLSRNNSKINGLMERRQKFKKRKL